MAVMCKVMGYHDQGRGVEWISCQSEGVSCRTLRRCINSSHRPAPFERGPTSIPSTLCPKRPHIRLSITYIGNIRFVSKIQKPVDIFLPAQKITQSGTITRLSLLNKDRATDS